MSIRLSLRNILFVIGLLGTIVSKHVIPMCFKSPLDDKFTKVSQILDGWLIMKLSIIPAFASTSHITIMPSTSESCAIITNTFVLICFCKYFFLSAEMFSFGISPPAPSIMYQNIC